jgi:hypothetical protein
MTKLEITFIDNGIGDNVEMEMHITPLFNDDSRDTEKEMMELFKEIASDHSDKFNETLQ